MTMHAAISASLPQAGSENYAQNLIRLIRLRRKFEAQVHAMVAFLDELDVATEDLEDGADLEPSLGFLNSGRYSSNDTDLEDDPAEDGIADYDGLREQTVGEPSLGATVEIDQGIAWLKPDGFPDDGEATGTEADIQTWKTAEAWQADRQAADDALRQVQAITRGRRVVEHV